MINHINYIEIYLKKYYLFSYFLIDSCRYSLIVISLTQFDMPIMI